MVAEVLEKTTFSMFMVEDLKDIHASVGIETPNTVVEFVASCLYSEFSVSVLGLDTYCPDRNICGFPQCLWANAGTVP